MQKKNKIVWICHFSNEEIRSHIETSVGWFQLLVRRLLGKSNKVFKSKDFAPWINNLIKEFEELDDVELHIIAPVMNLSENITEFELSGVYYHFFKGNLSFPFEQIASRTLGSKRKFKHNSKLVHKLVSKLKPDIINLIGSENPYYSSTVLGINNIPIYVSAQTVYTNPDREKFSGHVLKLNWDLELQIHNKEQYFGCGGRMHRDLILNNNPQAIIFKMFFPIEKPLQIKEVPKIYDFVFFAAGVTQKKGIEDAIDAISIVKKQNSGVSFNIVGGCTPDYKSFLKEKIRSLNLEENVSFNDYFPIHADMHRHIKKARFALLPNKLDVISSTVIEAILLDLPLVTYRTSGTPFLNKDKETVLLADIGDVEVLAEQMICLLNDPKLANQMKQDAKAFVEREFDNTTSAKRLLSNYKSVINHYHHNIPIPEDQLFNTDEFPIY